MCTLDLVCVVALVTDKIIHPTFIQCTTLTWFDHFCNHHQGAIQECKEYTNNCTKCIINGTLDVTLNVLSATCGYELSEYDSLIN